MEYPEYNDEMWPLLSDVKRPSRYAGCEFGARPPKEGKNGLVRFCLAFPDVYEIGMSFLGFQILYFLLKDHPLGDAERVYCPWTDMEALLREKGLPLTSIESTRPMSAFDVVGFTLQYELSYTNILTMLDLGGIPLLSEDRREGDPLVCAGGVGALTPEPLAPFIDFFCVGDGEELLPEVVNTLSRMKGYPRGERLEALSRIEGVYVPSLWEVHYEEGGGVRMTFPGREKALPVRRRAVASLDDAYFPSMLLVPSGGIVHDRIPVELFRGCTRGCRFCQAGMVTRPVRERSASSVVEKTVDLVQKTGWEEVGLLSLSSCDYTDIRPVIRELTERLSPLNVTVSLPSLRMDTFSVNLAAQVQSAGRGGVTFAPEAGTQRLRDVINKGVTDSDFDACLTAAFQAGWDRIKLYFMMGLPTETTEDLDGIVRMGERALALGKSCRKRAKITLSVAGFVPKPHTPFQWEPQLSVEELRERGRYLKSAVGRLYGGKNSPITLKYHEPEQTFLEGVFARGDRRLAPALLAAWRKGARFDGWTETFSWPLWRETFSEQGVDPAFYTSRERHLDEPLPWDHIDAGVSREFLARESRLARQGILSPDCRPLGSDEGSPCRFCGIIDCPVAERKGRS